MSNRLEFDACEMSSSEYLSRLAAKKLPFVALPVFASRVFRHGLSSSIAGSSPRLRISPASVPLYTQTAVIFIRCPMQYDLGVDLDGIEWVQGAVNSVIRRSTSRRTEAASRLAISWRPARSTPLLAPICRACSTVTPTRAAISRLSRARKGFLSKDGLSPDHAYARDP